MGPKGARVDLLKHHQLHMGNHMPNPTLNGVTFPRKNTRNFITPDIQNVYNIIIALLVVLIKVLSNIIFGNGFHGHI